MSAVVLTLGTSFETEGPGLSAFIMCIFPPPLSGMNAMIKTRTPIPPTQWVKLRHIRNDFGSASTSENILAPVVVNPDGCIDRCHKCGNNCPVGAITYVGDNTGWIPPVLNGKSEKQDCACGCGCGCGGNC